jgi:hypothetical protein
MTSSSFNPHFLIRTYNGDKEWLKYCLASLRKWAPNIPLTVVAPVGHEVGCPVVHVEPKSPNGYIDQQYTKLHADLFVSDVASHVVHLDSDCIMINGLGEMFANEKPVMLKTPYSQLDGQANVWRGITAHYLGFDVEYEYMRRMPLAYPVGLYPKVRDHLISLHGPFDGWFSKIDGHKFSEFNILGAYAERHMPEFFHWVDTSLQELPPPVARQGWSWGGLDASREEWEKLTGLEVKDYV